MYQPKHKDQSKDGGQCSLGGGRKDFIEGVKKQVHMLPKKKDCIGGRECFYL